MQVVFSIQVRCNFANWLEQSVVEVHFWTVALVFVLLSGKLAANTQQWYPGLQQPHLHEWWQLEVFVSFEGSS
jgi:hypothetical protein